MLNEEFYVRLLNKDFMPGSKFWDRLFTKANKRALIAFAVLFLVMMTMFMFRIDNDKNKESCCELIAEKKRMISYAKWFPIAGMISLFIYILYSVSTSGESGPTSLEVEATELLADQAEQKIGK